MAGRPVLQAFFLSVHTMSTVGYGSIAPATLTANALVTLEIMLGLFGVGLTAGLIFARFSRPRAEIAFSRNAVVAPYQGISGLMFRIVNQRRSQIIDLKAKVIYSRFETDEEGQLHRRFYNLELERDRVTFFPLSWTIVHPIDEQSPLRDQGPETCQESEAEFLVLLTGLEETFSQMVHIRTSYLSSDVVWDARFKPIFELPEGRDVIAMDVSRIDDLERL